MRIQLVTMLGVLVLSGTSFAASAGDRSISELELYDKLHGMWLGQLIGNATGRPTEGTYAYDTPNPDDSVPWQIKQTWDADDDTDIEYLALHILATHGFDCNSTEIAAEWLEHLTPEGIYVANKQAWWLMLDGYLPPETGSRACNQHWYSIDAQIGTEALGAISPGLPDVAMELAGRFGRITNAGFAVQAAQFYAALYAQAFFESDVPTLISDALAALPPESRTALVITDVLTWYADDCDDGLLDWRATRAKLYDNYQGAASQGRYYNWVESTINTGATVLALLYGQGDFEQTVQIAVLAGWDCDCNPATAGGLLGIILGYSNLPADLTDPSICGETYVNVSRPGLLEPTTPLPQSKAITDITQETLDLAIENILRNGGDIQAGRFSSYYTLSSVDNAVYDVTIAALIGSHGALGLEPAGDPNCCEACVAYANTDSDRRDLAAVADGNADNSQTGQKPYSTYLPPDTDRPALDWYQLTYDKPMRFDALTFYEGDVVWSKINAYCRADQARGGFFEDLTVQVLQNDQYVQPPDVTMSPALDRYVMYQTITFAFQPTVGTAIRIVGRAGGTEHFTTILELDGSAEPYCGSRLVSAEVLTPLESEAYGETILLRFSDALALDLEAIRVCPFNTDVSIDLSESILAPNDSSTEWTLTLACSLAPGIYHLEIDCTQTLDVIGLRLRDDDSDPTDGLCRIELTIADSAP